MLDNRFHNSGSSTRRAVDSTTNSFSKEFEDNPTLIYRSDSLPLSTMSTAEYGELLYPLRFLQEVPNGTETDPTGSPVAPIDSEIIRSTLRTYGSIYLVLIVIFCFVRNRYPRVYNVRSWAPDIESDLAQNFFGSISWFWKVWIVGDDDFRDNNGMDALCFVRVLRFGLRLSLVGAFNSIWLLPVYATSPVSESNDHITDPLAMLTAGYIPPGSNIFIATVIATYIHFGSMMYLLLKEFKWFTENRHKYLSSLEPRSYTVYVSHIPAEYRSSAKLLEYFRSCFSYDAVIEAQVALKIPILEKQFAIREKLVNKLEHAINVNEITGKTPMHRSILGGIAKKVNSIETYTDELEEVNAEIKRLIIDIEQRNNPISGTQLLLSERSFARDAQSEVAPSGSLSSYSDILATERSRYESRVSELSEGVPNVVENTPLNSNSERDFSGHIFSTVRSATGKVKSVAGGAAASGLSFVFRGEDGEPREAGFVTFANLKTTQAALQQIHNEVPFAMEVAEAPQPDDIFWGNVGKSHQSLQIGKLLSFIWTSLLCLLWTIPVAAIASLTEVNSLKGTLPFLAAWSEAWPSLDLVLAQIAPLALILVNMLLPFLLGQFSKMEGPVSSSVLEASLFFKLAMFAIIQTFFVSTFSGSVMSEITNILNNPTSVVDLLANSIPGQSSYFMQILFVKTFLGQGLELVRVVPVAIAGIRSIVGPNLTEKERNSPWIGLSPLASPGEFGFADVLSNSILYFMVVFVYGTIAPVTNWFMAFCFALMISGYRNQLIFIYPPTPDSGGQLWIQFFGISQTMVLIAEIAIFGFLGLKKAALAVSFMVPLIVITILFNFYVRQKHFLVSLHLPSRTALKKDLQNQKDGPLDMSFVRGAYVQEALKSKEPIYPENSIMFREMELQQSAFMTPPGSETDLS